MSRIVLTAIVVCVAAAVPVAQQTTSTETKSFEVISVDGNQLVVTLPEGTRELTVPDDFQFNVDGQPMTVRELKAGMKGTATITTRTTVTPVTVTEIKSGTVAYASGGTIIVRTDEGIRSFTQGEVDKRGVKIMRSGKPAQVSDFRQGDRLSATIITSMPPKVVTEQEVQATLAAAPASSPARAGSAAGGGSASSASATGAPARTLPKTASPRPLIELATVLALMMGLALMVRRHLVQ